MRRHNHAQAWAIAGAALSAAVAAGACNSERERTADRAPVQQAERAPMPLPNTDVDQVKEHPAWYYDKKVRVTGEIDEIYSNLAFSLEGTGWAFDDNITVLTKKPADPAASATFAKGDELIVNGTVRRFVVADIERDLGWDLAPEVEIKLKERPVLVAESVRKITPEQAKAAAEVMKGDVETVTEILAVTDQKSLHGKNVDLDREKVQTIVGKGMWIGPSTSEKVFVIPKEMPKDVVAGDFVSVSGELEEVPANAIETWNLPKEMANDLGKFVFIDDARVREIADDDQRRN
ncbi:hypothetical protein SAMN02745121_08493 [Nannocystis exedens]|uniref:Lipoprotein n=1 Tax=Nannocystis exedens TaxID=54 RepID=A0A1I2IBB0_9BACT|nr:hypothetical protein [Nannocystis exedens]PCC74124.1 hypothetical protein NAEX_07213 [Nannocystis exedens]SFF38126.1 hypothetical protein SAMN02745121_08493 [Nannocystis exedens]